MKINKSIEIISSTRPGLSSMGNQSRQNAKKALAKHFAKVDISIINNLSDLEALVSRKPDLVFLGMKYLSIDPNSNQQNTNKIWLSDYFDNHNIAHTSSNRTAISLERDKHRAKQSVLNAGLQTAPFFVVRQNQVLNRTDINLKYPLFVKPTNLGGGLGIDRYSIVNNFKQLKSKISAITSQLQSDSLVEQYLTGREFSVAILKRQGSSKYTTMPIELIAPVDSDGNQILSGDIKSLNLEFFTKVEDEIIKSKINSLALNVFHALGGNNYGRIDVRLNKAGEPQFLEANLLPSLLENYGSFPKACWLNEQLDYESMLRTIVDLAMPKTNINKQAN